MRGVRIKQARCTCFCDTHESESCLVKAPAKYASESVLVVGELLCTGVQANTERHTRKETREMWSCWGYKQHSSSRKSGDWRDSNFQQSSRLANLGSKKKPLEILLTLKGLAKPLIRPLPAIRAVSLNARRDDTGDQLSRVRIIQTSLLAVSRSFTRMGYRQSFCAEESSIIVEIQQFARIISVT